MKQRLESDAKAYHDYYLHQAGKGYPVYAGSRYQRGHGLGSIFGGLIKAAMPLLKKGAKTLGREALKTGLNIVGDAVEGKNIKEATTARLKSTGKTLLQKATDKVGPPGEPNIKERVRPKKIRRRQTKQQSTLKDIFGE